MATGKVIIAVYRLIIGIIRLKAITDLETKDFNEYDEIQKTKTELYAMLKRFLNEQSLRIL
jgi:hypothetical protein